MGKFLIAFAVLFLLLGGESKAQNSLVVQTCGTLPLAYKPGATRNDTVDVNGNKCISGSISASTTGFNPVNIGTPIAVTNVSTTGTLPAGAVVVATNVGSNGAFCALGASATTSSQFIPAGSWFAFTVGASTQLSCITSSSTTTINLVGGSGLPTGTGGGGGSGGGAVFGPTAVGSAAANPPVLIGGTANATATGNVQVAKVDANGTQFIDCSSISNIICAAINSGVFTNGSAPPTTSIWIGALASGATGGLGQGIKQCDQSAFYDSNATGSTQLVAGVASRKIYVCGYILGTGATATNLKLVEGTTTTTPCDTGTVSDTPAWQLAANAQMGMNGPFWNGFATQTAGKNLCINASAANAAQAMIMYTIQ